MKAIISRNMIGGDALLRLCGERVRIYFMREGWYVRHSARIIVR